MKGQEPFEQISKKLGALLAISLMSEPEKRSNPEKIKLLVRFGLSNQEIANILGTTKGTVEVLKSRVSKANKKKSYASTAQQSATG